MSQRLAIPPTAFSNDRKVKKHPRVKAEEHLKWIRTLPCVVSGKRDVQAAHIRYPDSRYAKRAVGLQEKPDDKWAIPLNWELHREQHSGNEQEFWTRVGLDPVPIAAALWASSGDTEAGEQIIREFRKQARAHEHQS